ncbi:dTDP-4-amino-4,6-dideoxygalactose transaminase [Thermosporothrix hazakensis]|uniref:dTDP-4-amino-4,6-dideoxygalactose transaminase n=2 Tax=Thermosporothrix TaxID=768650 RepID=A0A326UPP5_THEHA|nr:DegT/DnrJ/EryC1/StrS family aminotransferase [Thermosporothrix hazakensis]PZW36159.1 dTDP-4-amino-4,6-dideoxygalactose transaminase [Thermosporothrix hazakensis]BBH88625.1 glutamine--scyllo-inositol aminotransferase [Thermosporothrix sp. COM3]GCE46810.1 glutamine--scyllo-inositol aminotransferase [Thermosporothrix hazakensis]
MPSLKVPLVDLRAQYMTLKGEILRAFEEVLDSMQLFLGPRTQAFEEQFAAFCGCRYGVGNSSGTEALALALRACDIGPGDEVITVSNTFIATVEAIAQVGATPVFVDVDPETYLMDWRQLERVVTPRTRALLPVHLYGHAVEMGPVMEFARSHNLRVIEDASQAHGATYQGQRVGSFGDIACFSLYFSKNIGAFGEAGICTTNDAELAAKMRMLRDHGSRVKYHHDLIGGNWRMDELQAAALLVKLPHLERWNEARQVHARAYTEQLRDVVEAVPVERPWGTHVFCYYVVQVPQRDRFREALEQEGIGTNIHYPIPIHLQPCCARYGYQRGSLPVTEAAAERIVSLPMYPELTPEQRQMVIDAVKRNVSLLAAQA